MIDRRSHLLRDLRGGLVLGAAGGLLLALLEAARVVFLAGDTFDATVEKLHFAVLLLGLLGGAGALLGLVEGLVFRGAVALADRFARPTHRRAWEARVFTIVLAPPVTLAVCSLLSGRRVQAMRGHALLVVAAAALSVAGLYFAIRLLQVAARWILEGEMGRGWAIALAVAALGDAVLALLVDRFVLPRLYPAFHIAAQVASLASCQIAVGAIYLSARRRGARWPGRLLNPGTWSLIALAAVAVLALSLRSFNRREVQRTAAHQHSGLPSQILRLAKGAGVLRAPLTPVAPPLPPRVEKPLPVGPHLAGADVFLITVDAMRGDRLTPQRSPRLWSLAERGVIFDAAYTMVPHTSFALASLLTGKYVQSLAALGEDPSRHETLADVFQRARYKTAAFFPPAVFYIDRERFTDVEKAAYRFEYVKYEYMKAPGRTDQVISFLEAEKPERVFAWVHYFEPHEPYELHDGVTVGGKVPVTAEERYDGEIAFVDGEVGRLIDYLRRTRPRSIIAFTADHGEEFGEHGGSYHGTTLYEEQVRVPLVVSAPGLAPRRVASPVGLIDVGPTLLGLVDMVPSARMRGRDLGPWLSPSGAPEDRLPPVFAAIGSKKLVALGNERLICDLAADFCELFDVVADPAERHNLAGRAPSRVEDLRSRLDAWIVDQSRFERGREAGPTEQARQALERGRMGDRAAIADVARLLAGEDGKLRDEAADVLLGLPADPATRAAIDQARKARPQPDLRLEILAYRLVEGAPSATLSCDVDRDGARLCAHAALALAAARDEHALPMLLAVLPRVGEEDLEKRVITTLGWTRDVRAAKPLIAHLERVRTRAETVDALGRIGGPIANAAIRARVLDEPYVSARAAMVRALGYSTERAAAVAVLRKLEKSEPEAQVKGEIADALARLGQKRR